jgi:predicted nuclease of predicted toxin-antitoxin system
VRFLIDECCARALAEALTGAGHDVAVAQADHQGVADRDLASLAIEDDRILVSEDYDFGELAVREGMAIPGVILVSIAAPRAAEKAARLVWLVETDGDRLSDHLTILYADDVRRRRLR